LEFGIADVACLVGYEEDNNLERSKPNSLYEEAPVVDSLVNQLKED